MLIRILFILLISITISVKAQAKGNEITIAIVDVQEILDKSTAVSAIRSNVDKINQDLQNEFSSQEQELKKIEASLIEKKSRISQEIFDKELITFNKKVSDAQKNIHNKKISLEQAHAKAMSEVNEVAMKIISDIALENKYYLILPSNQVLYADNKLNITEEVLSRLNKKLLTIDLKY